MRQEDSHVQFLDTRGREWSGLGLLVKNWMLTFCLLVHLLQLQQILQKNVAPSLSRSSVLNGPVCDATQLLIRDIHSSLSKNLE